MNLPVAISPIHRGCRPARPRHPRGRTGARGGGPRPPAAWARLGIKDIGVIESQPAGVRLTGLKFTTDQDGLYGYGCATFTQRADWSNRRWRNT